MGKPGKQPEANLNQFNHQFPHHLPGNAACGSNMDDPRTPVALFHDLAWRRVLGKGSAITLFRPFGGARLEAARLNYCIVL
jgi:hypothetical protein